MIPRLKTTYEKKIINNLKDKLSVKNNHEVPKIIKIILNMGLGEDANDGKKLKSSIDDMALISGQKPIITKSFRFFCFVSLPTSISFKGVHIG